jgi:hypothetical protein
MKTLQTMKLIQLEQLVQHLPKDHSNSEIFN